MTPDTQRTWVAEIELAGPRTVTGVSRPQHDEDSSARVLVRQDHQLIGFVSMALAGPLESGAVVAAVEEQLADPLARRLRSGPAAAAPAAPPLELVSVVVCTRDRPEALAGCLGPLGRIRFGEFEVVIVDNAPTSDDTEACFARLVGGDPRFRYVREPQPGLSKARNRGLREARGRRVAFTDDDVRVDPWWLDNIAAGFARDANAGCVTGLAAAAELDHPAQQYFERRYSWASHMQPRVFDLLERGDSSPLYPYSAGLFGTGANFAVDRGLFIELGGFDEALGAGSPAGGGEDLDAFVRVLQAGRTLVYEPSAIVWHVHRAERDALREQVFSYGLGLTAFLTKHMADRHTAIELLRRVPEGGRRVRRLWSASEIGDRAPAALVLRELAGMICGPAAYLRGRRRLTRAAVQG